MAISDTNPSFVNFHYDKIIAYSAKHKTALNVFINRFGFKKKKKDLRTFAPIATEHRYCVISALMIEKMAIATALHGFIIAYCKFKHKTALNVFINSVLRQKNTDLRTFAPIATERRYCVISALVIGKMAIATALHGFNDLGHLVAPTSKPNFFRLKVFFRACSLQNEVCDPHFFAFLAKVDHYCVASLKKSVRENILGANVLKLKFWSLF